ncbi:uncharacterized protein TNCV_142191 [Trichonephila clavipes]|nr:uncharacterized protein TNCV_142191 [Trichonephila clavipes]
MEIEKILEETDFPIIDKVLASADFGDLSSELDEPFDGVLGGTFSCDKCDSVFTHRRSLERHRISIHTSSALFHCKICKKRFNRKDNFVRHSKIHKLTPIIMKLSRTANGEENSSANTSSEAAPGPSTATETTLSDHGRTISSISTAPSQKRTVSPTLRARNACLDTFEVYTFFPDTSTSKDITVSLHSINTEILKKIKETASSKQGVKWYLNSCVHFIRKITTEDFETCTSYFRSRCAITLTQEIPDVEKQALQDAHIVDCRKHNEQKIKMPENKWLEFENFKFNLPVPYTIYADFESLIVKINSCAPDPERPSTVPIANHIPCGYAYVVIGPDGSFKKPPVVYRGENAVDHFLKNIIKEEEDILNILKKTEPILFF